MIYHDLIPKHIAKSSWHDKWVLTSNYSDNIEFFILAYYCNITYCISVWNIIITKFLNTKDCIWFIMVGVFYDSCVLYFVLSSVFLSRRKNVFTFLQGLEIILWAIICLVLCDFAFCCHKPSNLLSWKSVVSYTYKIMQLKQW